jgi:hypothetical protein
MSVPLFAGQCVGEVSGLGQRTRRALLCTFSNDARTVAERRDRPALAVARSQLGRSQNSNEKQVFWFPVTSRVVFVEFRDR